MTFPCVTRGRCCIGCAPRGCGSNMGFWGFTFPLGVFTSGAIALAEAIPSAFFAYLSLVQLVALVSADQPLDLQLVTWYAI